MSKIIIHYFTGTGNTEHSIKLISEKLKSAGNEVKIIQVSKSIFPLNEVFDYHIIAFPVLSWSAPVLMKKYVENLPDGIGSKAAVLAVNGAIISNGKLIKGYTGQALEEIEKILKQKKYDVFLTGNASFPDNWTQFTNPGNPQDIATIVPLGEDEVQAFTNKFLSGKKELYRCGFSNIIWTKITAILFAYVGRRILGKFYIADEHCTGCAICAKTCPVKTIKIENKKPYWNSHCEDCNRCINICPEKSIQVSVPGLIIQSAINIMLTIWAIELILTYVPQWLNINQTLLIGIETIVIISVYILLLWISMVPIDFLLRKLMRFRKIRQFFSFSYTQKYRRYKAPDFKP